jgi:hypothetical protein
MAKWHGRFRSTILDLVLQRVELTSKQCLRITLVSVSSYQYRVCLQATLGGDGAVRSAARLRPGPFVDFTCGPVGLPVFPDAIASFMAPIYWGWSPAGEVRRLPQRLNSSPFLRKCKPGVCFP